MLLRIVSVMETLASRLEELMRAHGFKSQSQLARRAGLPQSTIHRILQRQQYEPSLSTMAKLAEVFGVSLAWLVEGKGPARPVLQEAATVYGTAPVPQASADARLSEALSILESLSDTERGQVLAVLRLLDRR